MRLPIRFPRMSFVRQQRRMVRYKILSATAWVVTRLLVRSDPSTDSFGSKVTPLPEATICRNISRLVPTRCVAPEDKSQKAIV